MVAFVAKVDDALLCGIEVLFVGHLYVVLHVVQPIELNTMLLRLHLSV